ncbi:MAG: glycosyltransferase family A protein, partial [Pseudomonadota bacterium]
MAPPRVVCVVPIYGHSILANEAIGSALDQLSGTSLGVVAVNDGCPARETAELIEGWARAHPGQVVPVHQTNQGLSAARNIGIETALATWPELDAVFFLDADNRLERSAAALFHRLLDEDPAADWFFPNFDFFGIETYAHNGAAYSVARMSASNQCEAGSLLRRRVLDAGLRFNETMRAGYEDWDFWLQASAEGYRGARLTTTVFRYRKRPESMLSGSHAGDTTLREQISSQHRWLYARDGILQAALEEGPFAIRIATEDGRIETLSGPTLAPTAAPLDTLAETLFAALAQRERVRLPPFVLITRPPAEAVLGDARLGRGVFCHLQEGLVGADISLLRLGREVQDGNYWFENTRRWPAEWMPDAHAPEDTSVLDAFATAIRPAEALMIRTDRLVTALAERSASGLLIRLVSGARLTTLHASLPAPPPSSDAPGLAEQLTLTADRLLATRFATPGREAYRPWRWPAEITGPTKLPDVLSRSALNGAPLLLPRRGRPQIGFVLPILKFGGVEKCAVALAAAARTAGADCHLFVYGNQNAAA